MNRFILCLLLLIPLSLIAVVEIGSEFIGAGSPGMWRKVSETRTISPGMNEPTTTNIHYYYNQYIPTRLDSVSSYSSSVYSGGYKDRYDYFMYPDYHQTVIERWSWDSWSPVPSLSSITTITYNLDDMVTEKVVEIPGYGVSNRIINAYDSSLNLVSETEYRSSYSIIQPYYLTTHSYDAQNRLIHTQWTTQGQVSATRWQTWSSHSLPDSIYLEQPGLYQEDMRVTKHGFDPDGRLIYKSTITHYNPYTHWSRTDEHYYYLSAHGLTFPEHTFFQSGNVSSPNAAFTPANSTTITYNYTNDYHGISYSYGDNYSYSYNSNWLLTNSARWGDSPAIIQTINWEYYGPTANEDALSPQVLISSYPNPARHQLSLRLPKQASQPSSPARIYNLRGQLVRSLPPSLSATDMTYQWDCRDAQNQPVTSGIYLIRIAGPKGPLNHRVTVLR